MKKKGREVERAPKTCFESRLVVPHGKVSLQQLHTIAFNPMFEASVLTVAKRKSDMPIRAEDPTIA